MAFAAAKAYQTEESILARAAERNEPPLLVILDGVEDPHNLGAVLRTAEGAGVHGVFIPERRAAGLTSVVAKVSAGAIDHIPVARVTNTSRLLESLESGRGVDLRPGANGDEAVHRRGSPRSCRAWFLEERVREFVPVCCNTAMNGSGFR